jgi:phosphopantetheinyl transferase
MQECMSIAERFFPPMEAAELASMPPDGREVEFFRLWTRIEAKLKARGIGLYGAGQELAGEWTVLPIEVGPDYSAAVAANCAELSVFVHPYPPRGIMSRGRAQ